MLIIKAWVDFQEMNKTNELVTWKVFVQRHQIISGTVIEDLVRSTTTIVYNFLTK